MSTGGEVVIKGAHAGLIMPDFRFYIYKAIRKVLFLPFLVERSYFWFLMKPKY